MARAAIVLVLLLSPNLARADRIYLENGKSFDDVIVLGQSEDRIRFRVASGEMSLPLAWIDRIEEERGPLQEYEERRRALTADSAADAAAWLDLARWARAREIGHGFREALLQAGELDPELDGLRQLMAAIDYSFDSETGLWSEGRPAAPRPSRVRDDPPAGGTDPWEATGGAQEIAQGLTRALERLAEAELERTRQRSERPEPSRRRSFGAGSTAVYPFVSVPVGYVSSGWVFRGEPLRPANSDPKNPVIRNPRNAQARALLSRPPGSLLPLSAYQR